MTGHVSSVSDGLLITSAQAGDRSAMDQLLRRHYDRIWRLCRRLAGNDADAQDASQEALIAIARGLHRFDGRAAFTTWSYRVATNACLDELRRRKRRPVPAEVDTDVAATDGGQPFTQVTERLAIDAALERLPESYRVVVVLRDLCDLDYAEIGQVLDLAPGTVKSRIARGRAQLADHLRGYGNLPGPPERPSPQQP